MNRCLFIKGLDNLMMKTRFFHIVLKVKLQFHLEFRYYAIWHERKGVIYSYYEVSGCTLKV